MASGMATARERNAMRLSHRLALPLVLAVLAAAIGGCGSSEDIAAKSPEAILAASARAARSAGGVHVLSKLSTGKLAAILELQLAGTGGGRARLSFGRLSSETIRVGDTVYVEVDPALAERLAMTTGAHVSAGSWVKAPVNDPQVAQSALLTKPDGELAFLLRKPTLSLRKGATTTIGGQRAIELKTKGKLYSGAIYIAATGPPYPLKIVKHGRETGQITFTGWNDPVTPSAPANAIELSGLERHR